MNAMLNYILEANITLVICILVYYILLGGETQFALKRLFLLSSLIISFLFPLIHLQSAASSQFIPSVSQAVPSYLLQEVVITGSNPPVAQAGNLYTFWRVIFYVYLTGLAVSALAFINQLTKLLYAVGWNKRYRWNNCQVAESDASLPTFSFFRFVFIGHADRLSRDEKEKILRHEGFHARQLHSLDLIVVSLTGIVFWFNPIVGMYKKLLVRLHEFEADACMAEKYNVNSYCKLLAKVALQSSGYTLVNHFSKSLTLQRITMMKAAKKKIRGWKFAAVAAFLPLVFCIVACQEQVIEQMDSVAENTTMAPDYPSEVQNALKRLKTEFPEGNFKVIKLNEEEQDQIKEIKGQFGARSWSLSIINTAGQGERYAIVNLTKQVNNLIDVPADSGMVFNIVEDPAKPVDGMQQYFQYLGEHIEYPAQAVKAGIEGKVFVSFIVQKDGSVSNVKVVKGIGGGCDAEAVRVVKEGPRWTPGKQRGKQVKQKMVLPVSFRLHGDDESLPAVKGSTQHISK